MTLDECCEISTDNCSSRTDLQLGWKIWCEENGHVAGSFADFGRKLRAVLPRVRDEQRRVNGIRERWYVGISLNPDTRTLINRFINGV